MNPIAATTVAALIGVWVSGGSQISPSPPRHRLARDLAVYWEGSRQLERVSRPGTYELKFPCTFVAGKEAALTVQVVQQEAKEEAGEEPYAECTVEEARELALHGSRVGVRFKQPLVQIPLAEGVASVRGPDGEQIGVGLAFAIPTGPVCVVPARDEGLIALARSVLPGEEVLVRGQVIGIQTGQPCVLVESLKLSRPQEPKDEPPWTVTVRWAGQVVTEFSAAEEQFLQLSCLYAPGAAEGVRLRLREFKAVDLQVEGHAVVAELADTPAVRQWGLQGRTGLEPNEGMLFYFEQPLAPVFAIKEVSFPLSVAFIGQDGTIAHIGRLTPGDPRPAVSPVPVTYVLEMKGGWFEEQGVGPGGKVTIP